MNNGLDRKALRCGTPAGKVDHAAVRDVANGAMVEVGPAIDDALSWAAYPWGRPRLSTISGRFA